MKEDNTKPPLEPGSNQPQRNIHAPNCRCCDCQLETWRRTTECAVENYKSDRHGCEISFGILPEAY